MPAQGWAMSARQASKRLRAMWARAPEPSGAGRRWMKVNDAAGMRMKVSQSMDIPFTLSPAEERSAVAGKRLASARGRAKPCEAAVWIPESL